MTIAIGDFDSLAYAAGDTKDSIACAEYIERRMTEIMNNTGAVQLIGFVEAINSSDKINFRNHVATTRIYKGNRKGKPSTPYLAYAKELLVHKWGVKIAIGIEAEDCCLITAQALKKKGYDVIICCIDKDLYQYAGKFYDYRTKRVFEVTKEEAKYNLYKQFLTGDSTDAIVGLAGVADGKAIPMLEGKPPEAFDGIVAREYIKRGYSYDYLLEQCRLIYLLRIKGEVYHFPIDRIEYEAIASEQREESK